MEEKRNPTGVLVTRRQMLRMLGMGAAGAVLAACAQPTPAPTVPPAEAAEQPAEATKVPEPAPEQITLRIDHRGYGFNPATGEGGVALAKLIAEYQELHPNVKIENTPVDHQGLDSQIWTERRLVARDGPDLLFGNWTYLIEKWMEADLVHFWDDYLDMPNPYVPGNSQWRDQFIMPSERQSNGKIAWLGLDNTTLWFFYNKDLFKQVGVQVPKMWPDLIDAFKTLKDNGIIPCGIYHNLAYAVWTFDPVANQILHDLFGEMAGGVEMNPLPVEVARFVKDGKYAITSPQYQDSFKIATDWWANYTPEGAFSGGDDQGYQFFLAGKAATRFTGCWENASLLKDMPTAAEPFEWGAFAVPIIPKSMSQYATEKPTKAVFIAGYLLFMIPAYNEGAKLDATADWLMFLSKPENLGKLLDETRNLVPNIKDVPLPKGLEDFAVPEDATFWYVNSWGSTHINLEVRDAWVRNWQNVLLGQMTIDQYNDTMQPLLEKAAAHELA
jgi:ABC-type glycerol-3-phosphate transport system substrate-binding protein